MSHFEFFVLDPLRYPMHFIGPVLRCGFASVLVSAVALHLFFSAMAVAQTTTDQDPQSETQTQNGSETQSGSAMRTGPDHFMRIRKDRKGRPVSLDTSITRYELTNDDGKTVHVDLIGAVHIGEKEYYQQLNKEFEKYDSMLFELVAPEGTVIPKGGRAKKDVFDIINPVAALQKAMQAVTGLEFQLEHVDYTKSNFVHADMSPEEFIESMTANGESISGYILKAAGQSEAMLLGIGGKDPRVTVAAAIFTGNKELAIRRAMADQIRNMDSALIIFEGKNGSTIIDHRNAKCMEVLRREIAAGETKIGIFYGAGHLMDMQRRLISDFKATRGGQHWLPAWKLTKREYKK